MFKYARHLGVGLAMATMAACTATQVSEFDTVITDIESVISQASTDLQAACNAVGPVSTAINSVAAIPSTAPSGGYTTAQQAVLNDEAAAVTACDANSPVTAQVIAALNQAETDAATLTSSAEKHSQLQRIHEAVVRTMNRMAAVWHAHRA